jgi:peptidoglycan/xylan/chitin deacetylase (PgdA/CDA1 family)
LEHFCEKHPDRPTRKRCFECKKYICVECQLFFMQRPFCSIKCLLVSFWHSILGLFITVDPKTKSSKIKWPKFISENPFRTVAYLVLFVILIVLWRSMASLTTEMRLMREAQSTRQAFTLFQSKELEIPDSLFSKPDAMVVSNKINITGEAAKNTVISLKINDRVMAVTLPQNDKFEFENIELNYGNNEIIVQGIDQSGRIRTLESLTTFFGSPRLNYLARDITRGDRKSPKIALTFDGGAGNGGTEHILDYLAEKDVKCTMFLTGRYIKKYPDGARQIIEQGHEVGNHTWTHPHLTTFTKNKKHNTTKGVTRESVQEELHNTSELFRKTTGVNMTSFWRAPFGEHNLEIRQWASELGYSQIGWTLGNGESMDTFDWVADTSSKVYKHSDAILHKLLDFGDDTDSAANGSIILMHLDTQRTEDPVYEIIPALIDSFQQQGYEFVTVSELLNR